MKTISLKIDQETKFKVLKLFGKTSNDLQQNVDIVNIWLKTQRHLPEMPSEQMIEYFIINNKFSLENTKKKIDAYYTARNLLHKELGNIHPKLDSVKDGFNSLYIIPLPKLKDSLYRIILVKLKPIPSHSFTVESHMANLINLYEIRMHEDLMFGDIVIFDYENLKLEHVLKVTPSQVKIGATILEKVYSNRLKEIHLINYPASIEILLKLTKLFIKQKLISRIHLHGSLDSLTEYVPLNLLPEDYGGKERSLVELEELWKQKLIEYGPRFDKLETMILDESLRAKPLKLNEQFGVEGSFRKLNLD